MIKKNGYMPHIIQGVFNGLLIAIILWLINSTPEVSMDTKAILVGILFAVIAIRDKLEELEELITNNHRRVGDGEGI